MLKKIILMLFIAVNQINLCAGDSGRTFAVLLANKRSNGSQVLRLTDYVSINPAPDASSMRAELSKCMSEFYDNFGSLGKESKCWKHYSFLFTIIQN